MALTDYKLVPVFPTDTVVDAEFVAENGIQVGSPYSDRLGYIIALSDDEEYVKIAYLKDESGNKAGQPVCVSVHDDVVCKWAVVWSVPEIYSTKETNKPSGNLFYNDYQSYSTTDTYNEEIPIYDTIAEIIVACDDDIWTDEPEPGPEPEPTPKKRRKIMMNGGYILVDCDGVNLTSELPATVDGLHDILMRSIALNKPIILYNCGSIHTPIGAACSIGESDLISVITYVGTTFTVAEDDTVTIL